MDRRRGRDGHAADAVLFDRLGNEPGRLCVLDEFAEVRCAGVAAFGGTDRLLNRRESAGEHAGPGKLLGICEEPRLESGEDFQLVRDEQLK